MITCIALVLVVLLQSSKGEGLAGAACGGGGGGLSGAVFGGRGAATFLSKATSVLAILFMFNCGALAYMSAGKRVTIGAPGTAPVESVVTQEAQKEIERSMQQQQQALPADSGTTFQVPVPSDSGVVPADASGN